MAGVSVDGPSGGRRALDSEINMIPMIDLLMVTVSFLLITAVWSHMARIDATANAPGQTRCEGEECDVKKLSLHVRTEQADKFVLEWREGKNVVSSRDVVRREEVTLVKGQRIVRYPDLGRAVVEEWRTHAAKRANTRESERVVVHTPNEMPYASMIAVMDAVQDPVLTLPNGKEARAFDTVLASD